MKTKLIFGLGAILALVLAATITALSHKIHAAPLGVDVTGNLVACWDFEESSGTRTDAAGSNDLTDNNTVTRDTGVVDYGAFFNSSNSESLSSASTSDLQAGDISFTWAAWVKADDVSDYQFIIS